ncbi:hypothetical protein LMG26696_01140 [Achromobacter pulmonis]|nr:hypothetical protein LMG26696_01140 [Achromobacter pulmonis]
MASEISADSGTPATSDTDQPEITRPKARVSWPLAATSEAEP